MSSCPKSFKKKCIQVCVLSLLLELRPIELLCNPNYDWNMPDIGSNKKQFEVYKIRSHSLERITDFLSEDFFFTLRLFILYSLII